MDLIADSSTFHLSLSNMNKRRFRKKVRDRKISFRNSILRKYDPITEEKWSDSVLKTLGIFDNGLNDFGIHDCLWKIVRDYLRIKIPASGYKIWNSYRDPVDDIYNNYKVYKICSKCASSVSVPCWMNFILEKQIYYRLCVDCFTEKICNFSELLKQRKTTISLKSLSNICHDNLLWLGVIDYGVVQCSRSAYERVK